MYASKEELEVAVFDLIEDISGDDSFRDDVDMDVFEEGIFDSMAAIEFLVSIESVFGVHIAPTELERDEMNTPSKMVERIWERYHV